MPVAEAWSLQGMRATFTASAAVATREVVLQVLMAGVVRAVFKSSRQQAANAVADYGLVTGGPAPLDATLSTGVIGVPDPFILEPGSVLQTATAAIQAGDTWTNIALDVIFELNRGAGAAKRYAAWVKEREAALPDVRAAGGDLYRG